MLAEENSLMIIYAIISFGIALIALNYVYYLQAKRIKNLEKAVTFLFQALEQIQANLQQIDDEVEALEFEAHTKH